MSNSAEVSSCALPPHHFAWLSLVRRSIAAWDDLAITDQTKYKSTHVPSSILEECYSLDNFFDRNGNPLMFWFFQQRSAFMSQKRMAKWSADNLNDYVL